MATVHGKVLKRGVLLKQGQIVKNWKERLFVLYPNRLCYYDLDLHATDSAITSAVPKGVLLLSDISEVLPLLGRGSFQVSVIANSSSSSVNRAYLLVADNDDDRHEWITSINKQLMSPTRIAEVLHQATDMHKQGKLCSRQVELIKEWLLSGVESDVECAVEMLQLAAQVKAADRASDETESLLIDFELANTETELLRIMDRFKERLREEPPNEATRVRIVEHAMAHYACATGLDAATALTSTTSTRVKSARDPQRWTTAVQEAFGEVLHTIAVVVDNAARANRRQARRSAKLGNGAPTPDAASDDDTSDLSDDDDGDRSTDIDVTLSTAAAPSTATTDASNLTGAASVNDVDGNSATVAAAPTAAVVAAEVAHPSDVQPALRSPGSFRDNFDIGDKLGDGAYSIVYKARNKQTGETVAAKVALKERMTSVEQKRLIEEVGVMSRLQHPNIIKLHCFYEEDDAYYIVTELMTGGELFEKIVQRAHYSEREAREVVRTIAEAVAYLHSIGVCHRDLKPENILLSEPEQQPQQQAIQRSASRGVSSGVDEIAAGTSLTGSGGRPVSTGTSSTSPNLMGSPRLSARMSAAAAADEQALNALAPSIAGLTLSSASASAAASPVIKIADMGFAKRVPSFEAKSVAPSSSTPASVPDIANSGIGGSGRAASQHQHKQPNLYTTGLSTSCGTPSYVSPEILKGERYGLAVDMWSIGVITYILLCGYAPFASRNQTELFRSIVSGKYYFDSPYWDGVSAQARDLIAKLLVVEPRKRATAAEILNHPWLAKDNIVSNAELSSAVQHLRQFTSKRRSAIKAGVLIKQGAFIRSWKRRVFVLTSDTLEYYDSSGAAVAASSAEANSDADVDGSSAAEQVLAALSSVKPKGGIATKDIVGATAMDGPAATTLVSQALSSVGNSSGGGGSIGGPGLFLFKVSTSGGREYVLAADSAASRSEWLRAISTTRQHGDLLRKAFVAMAGEHIAEAVALVKMARQWEDMMHDAAGTGSSSKGAGGAAGGGGQTKMPVAASTPVGVSQPIGGGGSSGTDGRTDQLTDESIAVTAAASLNRSIHDVSAGFCDHTPAESADRTASSSNSTATAIGAVQGCGAIHEAADTLSEESNSGDAAAASANLTTAVPAAGAAVSPSATEQSQPAAATLPATAEPPSPIGIAGTAGHSAGAARRKQWMHAIA